MLREYASCFRIVKMFVKREEMAKFPHNKNCRKYSGISGWGCEQALRLRVEVWSSVGRGHTNPEALTSSERDQFYTRLGGKRHQWVSVGTYQRVEDGDKWEISCLSLVSGI